MEPARPEQHDELERLRAQVRELTEENGLLLLRMHELYGQLVAPEGPSVGGLDSREADPAMLAFLRRWWAEHPTDEIVIDLCQAAAAVGWHAPEAEGRWTGPGMSSRLRVPALPPGLYHVRVEVTDAMQPDILIGTRMVVDGDAVDVEVLFDGYPALVMGTVEVAGPGRVDTVLELRVPRAMSPRERGEDDDRLLGIRARTVTWTRLEAR